ncbi:MAG: AI-2E family transporter [Paludibacteraceae bacterium]|jgi:predicted PurR-regulated permease PerM|nr:AI-2E family transporter [Paludibacteraceae bacterium]
MFSKPFTLDRTVRIVGVIIIIIGTVLLINKLSGVLLPFFAAWLIAYMINPMVEFVQNKMHFKNRLISVLTIMLLFLGIIVGIGFLAANSIEKELIEVDKLVDTYLAQSGKTEFAPFIQDYISQFLQNIDFDMLLTRENIVETIEKVIPKAFDIMSSSLHYITGLVVIFIMILYMFFILVDFKSLSTDWEVLIPKRYRKFSRQLFSDLASGMNIYFRKQALISSIVGCLFAIGFSIIGLPMGVAMGLFVGLLNMIPYLHTLGIIPPLLIALIQSAQSGSGFWMTALWIVLTFCIIQVILDGFLTPKIMGKATGLNPAVILLSLSIWGSLMGVLGMIIALPVTTLMISYYKHFVIGENNDKLEDVNNLKV